MVCFVSTPVDSSCHCCTMSASFAHSDVGDEGARVLGELVGLSPTLFAFGAVNLGMRSYGATTMAWGLARTSSLHSLE